MAQNFSRTSPRTSKTLSRHGRVDLPILSDVANECDRRTDRRPAR